MKVLFISLLKNDKLSGGDVCSNRNLMTVRKLYGDENVIMYNIKREEKKSNRFNYLWKLKNIFIDIFELSFAGLDNYKKKEINQLIKTENIDVVFIDRSLFGSLNRQIKRINSDVKVITFFHNVEFLFYKESILVDRNYIMGYRIILAYISELLACKYSDKIISLNTRDANKIEYYYKRKVDNIIPISIVDNYLNSQLENKYQTQKVALFIGSYFFANVQGIKWFIENVMNHLNIKLLIVGSGMEKLKYEFSATDRIEIFSDVPSLAMYYELADFVVLPIFSGSGMKVKTAEALMYGKYLIGTNEAFTGYDISKEVGICCNTSSEFIEAINNFGNTNKFNKYSRKLFLENYSFKSTINLFKKLFVF